ncbi:ornithine cyclodeaminase family protein [Nocardia sp. CS682]|uniref:ornithine cyclodeaminase family protein n=1 Tax=Nocardia sp. CS682 TaxID=1047172 RepID=UPI001074F3FA|nr:ornithine cyclodeaminase family protein [Nocardia sp. CS682]QBS39407.1 ornithine cyclodeaminase [Nocardia sp. CS682]
MNEAVESPELANTPSRPVGDRMQPMTEAEVAAAVDLPALVAELGESLRAGQRHQAVTPIKFVNKRMEPYSVFGAMPSISTAHGLFITKVAALVKLPGTRTINAVVVAFDTATGDLLAVLDGAALTDIKCAAVTALVTDHCAIGDARRLGVVGAGVLALQQIRGVATVRDMEVVTVYGRHEGRTDAFADRARALLPRATEVRVARDLRAAVEGQDVVCTATTSSEPLLGGFDLRAPVHVNCMGAHTPRSREVSTEQLAGSVVIVEDRESAVAESGELHSAALELEDMLGAGADLRAQRTIFSSNGHSFLDLVATAHVLSSAKRR